MINIEAYAAGRVELLGNHTDYNEGVTLGAAIDRGITVSGNRHNDEHITLESASMGTFHAVEIPRHPVEQTWANYSLGVARELMSLGLEVPNFSANISGDLLPGLGLSSSAALEVSTAIFLLKLIDRRLPGLELAKLCQRAEHNFIGVQCGLLDQICSIFGKAGHAVFFDAREEGVQTIRFPPNLALIIAESGSKHQLTDGLYNERRNETRAAAASLGVSALRDVSLDMLEQNELPDLLRRRAAHIVGENDRVWRAREILGAGDAAGFGALMNESQESSENNFENSTPEIDLMVDIARGLPGVLGARLTGGGFGGATVTLCRAELAEAASSELARQHEKATGHRTNPFVCRISDGALSRNYSDQLLREDGTAIGCGDGDYTSNANY
jgi:galactokinase